MGKPATLQHDVNFVAGDLNPQPRNQGMVPGFFEESESRGFLFPFDSSSDPSEVHGGSGGKAPDTQKPSQSVDSSSVRIPILTSHQYVQIFCENCGKSFPVMISCKDKTCSICRRVAGNKIRKKYNPLLKQIHRPKFLTLTMKSRPSLTRRWVDEFRSNFNKLLRRKPFDKMVYGGLYAFHVTYGDHGWHLHLHCVLDAEFIWHGVWKRAWKAITGDSIIVDIRPKKSAGAALGYLCQYISKPADIRGRSDEFNDAFAGRRLVQSFGSLYNAVPKKEPFPCEHCGNTVWMSEFELMALCNAHIVIPRAPPQFIPEVYLPGFTRH